MKSKNISEEDFLKVTRKIESYKLPYTGEITHFKQDIGDLIIHFAVAFKEGLRVSHLRITTKWDKKTLTKPMNLILTNEHKNELYKIIKSLSYEFY